MTPRKLWDPAETYVSPGSTSMTYVPMPRWEPPEGQYNELFITAAKKGSAPQAMFLDYVQLKGVENLNIDFHPGEPPRLTITMILGKVTYVEDDSEKE